MLDGRSLSFGFVRFGNSGLCGWGWDDFGVEDDAFGQRSALGLAPGVHLFERGAEFDEEELDGLGDGLRLVVQLGGATAELGREIDHAREVVDRGLVGIVVKSFEHDRGGVHELVVHGPFFVAQFLASFTAFAGWAG